MNELRRLDLVLLFGSIFFILLYLRQSNHNMLEPSFSIPISTQLYKNSHHSSIGEELPRPIVVDFKDNNQKYLVLVSHDPSIKIYQLGPTAIKNKKKMKSNANGNSNSKSQITTPILYKKKSLLVSMNSQKYNKIGISRGTRPVGLGVGSIKRKKKEGSNGNSKSYEEKIIIVVTESWQVICFDSELNTLWQVYAQSQVLPKKTIFQELTILITHHEIYEGDLGMVIIGGRVGQKKKLSQDQPEKNSGHSSNGNTNDNPQKVTIAKNFEYYCFAARTGKLRWKSTPNFQNGATASAYGAASSVHFVSQFKSAQINTRLSNWRVFRESVLYQLPYSWQSKFDSNFRLANFQKDRSSRETKGINYSKDKLNEKLQREPPNALVAHVKNGFDVLHLYTGVQICYVPLTSHGSYGDLSGNLMIDHIEATLSHDYIQSINQVGAKQKGNANYYTGNRHLGSRRSSADDHQFPRLSLNSKDSMNWKIPICFAQANSDLIKREPLWNNTICTYSDLLKSSSGVSSDTFGDGQLRISLLDPILIPDLETKSRRYLSIFAISNGNLLAISHNGETRWSINTNANWIADFDEDEQNPLFDQIFTPILHPFKNNILLIGKKTGLIIESTNGKILTNFEIPNYLDSPISAPWVIIEDFDGDGLSDLIIETRKAYIGFSQKQSTLQSTSIPTILFFFLVFYLITLLLFFYNNSSLTKKNNYKRKKRKRGRKSSSILNERFHM